MKKTLSSIITMGAYMGASMDGMDHNFGMYSQKPSRTTPTGSANKAKKKKRQAANKSRRRNRI